MAALALEQTVAATMLVFERPWSVPHTHTAAPFDIEEEFLSLD